MSNTRAPLPRKTSECGRHRERVAARAAKSDGSKVEPFAVADELSTRHPTSPPPPPIDLREAGREARYEAFGLPWVALAYAGIFGDLARLLDERARLREHSIRRARFSKSPWRPRKERWRAVRDGWERTVHMGTNAKVELDGDRAHLRAELLAMLVHQESTPPEPYVIANVFEAHALRSLDGWRFKTLNLRPVWSSRRSHFDIESSEQ